MKEKATREEVIEFLLKEQRSPSTKIEGEKRIKWAFHHFVYDKKDEEIIALKNKFADNTKRHMRLMMSATMTGETAEERVARIRRQHEETGLWPAVDSTDYNWISNNNLKLEEIKKLREEMRQRRLPVKKANSKKSVAEKTPVKPEARKISDLTLSEISELLKIIGDTTVEEIQKRLRQENKQVIAESNIDSTLPMEILRIIMNPERECVVTNPNWEVSKELMESLFSSKALDNNLAARYIIRDERFVQALARYVMDHPNERYHTKKKSIADRLYKNVSPDLRFYENPSNISDLIESCMK